MTTVILHSAQTSPAQMAALVGMKPTSTVIYPQATAITRWDHLGNTDVPQLMALGGEYIMGFSSGAFMAMRMLRERQYKAAVIVAGGLIERYIKEDWLYPCPVLLINGTADLNVPYEGVPFMYQAGMDAALSLDLMLGGKSQSVHTPISNRNFFDGCRAYVDDWQGEVRLYTVLNGGHTWPGSTLNPPTLGRTCMDFSATDVANEWFRRHP